MSRTHAGDDGPDDLAKRPRGLRYRVPPVPRADPAGTGAQRRRAAPGAERTYVREPALRAWLLPRPATLALRDMHTRGGGAQGHRVAMSALQRDLAKAKT